MSEAREPLRRIVVAGSGQVGTLAAIALKRALPACEVIVIGTPPAPDAFADNAATALPFTNKLHDRLGITEAQIVAQAGGSHRLVTRCFGWTGQGSHGATSYGAPSDPAMQTGFARDWGGGPTSASNAPAAQTVAEALADAGRFATPPADRETPLSEVDYALRWNVAAYRQGLIGAAQKLGAAHIEGVIGGVRLDDTGSIAGLTIEGRGEIEADLFIDCGGPAAPLLSQMPGFAREDWNAFLPIRRIHFAQPGKAMLALEDRVTLLPEGWLSEHAGRDGLQTVLACPASVSDDAAARALGSQPALSMDLTPSRCREAWIGNAVALGDATAQFEPLVGLPLDLAHRQLALLIETLPGRQIESLERAEFNRRAGLMMDAVRDALAMHYAAPHAGSVFSVKAPDHVTRTIDQFTRRGRLPFQEEAPFLTFETIGLLAALGFTPGTPPQFSAMDPRQIEVTRQAAAGKVKAALEFAPPYQQWMAQVLPRKA